MALTPQSGLTFVAKFEKGIVHIQADVFGLLITFDDGAQAYLLPPPEMIVQEKSVSVVH